MCSEVSAKVTVLNPGRRREYKQEMCWLMGLWVSWMEECSVLVCVFCCCWFIQGRCVMNTFKGIMQLGYKKKVMVTSLRQHQSALKWNRTQNEDLYLRMCGIEIIPKYHVTLVYHCDTLHIRVRVIFGFVGHSQSEDITTSGDKMFYG